MEGTDLDPGALVAEARRLQGDEETPLGFLPELEQLAGAIDAEAGLHRQGRERARAALVASLVTQLRVRRMTREVPGLDQVQVQPVFITGLLRTGTTFLQHLLAQHPDLRSPALWETMAPGSSAPDEELVATCEAYIAEYYRAAPDFRSIHLLQSHLPEECHRLTANSFRHFIYALRYRIPGYAQWLREQSMVPAYAFHQEQLRTVLWRRPGAPVLLKCPSHLWYGDDLAKVYPDAKVIRLHRDPSVAVPSVCSLTATVRAARSDTVDREEIGSYWLDSAAEALNGLKQGRSSTSTPPLDLRFRDVVGDPLGTAERVCDYIGVPLTAEARRRMTAFMAAENDATTGKHRYTPQEFGLTEQGIKERFAPYLTEFSL
ncbi:sulfotransferase [Kitasatospora sp. CB02891]|uniref:sulfotransferase family protein n=1 Tax=Kitasatospora sp. CB02891 TaxID=2020329 RepID=UPI000C27824C|nr:sulfotransferase [Kitasatospora sp. CB02891]PJN23233.1 sulfotransferase family protein [Kitasatospora sp. CB02891]